MQLFDSFNKMQSHNSGVSSRTTKDCYNLRQYEIRLDIMHKQIMVMFGKT